MKALLALAAVSIALSLGALVETLHERGPDCSDQAVVASMRAYNAWPNDCPPNARQLNLVFSEVAR